MRGCRADAGQRRARRKISNGRGVKLRAPCTALTRILEINVGDPYAVVEPGVITADFATAASEQNLFYPPDPGSQAVSTIAGTIAENAGGLRGLKCGCTKDYVMGIEFFDATGACPLPSGDRAGRRHRSPLPDPRHDEGRQ